MIFNKPPKEKFINSIESTIDLRQTIETISCPACKQQTLKLSAFTKSPKAWGAAVNCTNCNFNGEVNSTGFSYQRVDSKGKAKE